MRTQKINLLLFAAIKNSLDFFLNRNNYLSFKFNSTKQLRQNNIPIMINYLNQHFKMLDRLKNFLNISFHPKYLKILI